MAMNFNSQDNDFKLLGKNLSVAKKAAGGGSLLVSSGTPFILSGGGALVAIVFILLMLFDSGFTADLLNSSNVDQIYDNVFDVLKQEYNSEVRKGYSLMINDINAKYGSEYGCAININNSSQVYIPDTYHNDTYFGQSQKGYIRYSNDKCHVDLVVDVTPSLEDLSKIATVYYSSINSQLGEADYEVLTGHARTIFGSTAEEGTRYESVESADFYQELRETDYTLSSPKSLSELGFSKVKVELYHYKIEVQPEITCPVDETPSWQNDDPDAETCVPTPPVYEYEDHIFIGQAEPGGPSGNIVEINHVRTIGSGKEYSFRNVIYLDTYNIRESEIDNFLQYEVDNSDITYGDARTNYDDTLSFKFMNMIQTLDLEEIYYRAMFSSPYGDYIDGHIIGGFFYPDLIQGDVTELLDFLGLSSYDEMCVEIRALQNSGLILNSGSTYLQCTEFVSYMTYKIYGSNRYPNCDGINGASVLQSQGWSGSFNDIRAGTVLSRPAYDGTVHGHTMMVIARDGNNITIADANRNHRGGISIYTIDINTLNNSVGGRLQAATP